MSLTALLIEPQTDRRVELSAHLRAAGLQVQTAEGAVAGFNLATTLLPDLMVTALRLPRVDGLELLRLLRGSACQCPVIVTGGREDEALIRSALQRGALQAWTRPLDSDAMGARLRALLPGLQQTALHLHGSDPEELFCALAGTAPALQKICDRLDSMAAGHEPVFIHGEPGTGAALLAHLLHEQGPRRDKPLVWMTCAGTEPQQLAAELFDGVTEGRLTLPSRLDLAAEGTLVLDEVAALTPALQTRLLDILPDPVSGQTVRPVKARIVALTARSLLSEVSYGVFSRELYHRLDILSLQLPPLRRRADEIPELVPQVLRALAEEGTPPRLTGDALARFGQYYWPGNLQQLREVLAWLLARARAEARSSIERTHLPLFMQPLAPGVPTAVQERREAVDLVAQLGGDRRLAARLLGCPVRVLAQRLTAAAESATAGDRRA